MEKVKFDTYVKVAPMLTLIASKAMSNGFINTDKTVETLEGDVKAKSGDIICFGPHNDIWPQQLSRVKEKYNHVGRIEHDGVMFDKWEPKPDQKVEATQVNNKEKFRVGELTGKKGDYIVRDINDKSNMWIVDGSIFKDTYSSTKNI